MHHISSPSSQKLGFVDFCNAKDFTKAAMWDPSLQATKPQDGFQIISLLNDCVAIYSANFWNDERLVNNNELKG